MVRGYLIHDHTTGMETLYAVDIDGKVFKTGPHKPRDIFLGGEWKQIVGLPKSAEFIGNYPRFR